MKVKSLLLLIIVSGLMNAQYQNVRVDLPTTSSANEPSIAVNPANPLQLAAGANISYFFSSTDRGQTWTQKNMSSSLGVWGDPCLIYDAEGYLYYGHLSNPTTGYWIDRIVVQRSTNNGVNWNDGAGVGLTPPKEQDKEWLAVNLSNGPYKNHVYMSWTEFDSYGSSSPADSSRIKFSKSTDRGLTWLPAVTISDRSGDCVDEDNTVEGAVPAIGPDGEIYIAWSGPLGIMFDKSTDGGATFGTDKFVSSQPGGWDYSIPGIYRANGLPITLCDTSRGVHRGRIYVTWSDQRNGAGNTDVYVAYSDDKGNTWQPAIRVNDDNTDRHQFFNWMAIDQTTGNLYMVFYDRRNTANSLTDVYLGKSYDGGATWHNVRISQSAFNPNAGVFFGDYTNIAAHAGWIHPIWTRLDNTSRSIWTAAIYDSTGMVPVELTSFNGYADNSDVHLSWKTATELNNRGFEIQRATEKNPGSWNSIGFVEGKGTTAQSSEYHFRDINLSPGFYNYRLKQIDLDGKFQYSGTLKLNVIKPKTFVLNQNYPNPFNPSTTISFELPAQADITMRLYDAFGQLAGTLVSDNFPAGLHEVTIDTRKMNLSSGVYYYTLTNGEFTESKKMILMK